MSDQARLQQLREQFQRDGVVELGPILDDSELATLREHLDRLLFVRDRASEHVRDLSELEGEERQYRVMQLVNVYRLDDVFTHLLARPDIVEMVSTVLDASVGLLRDQAFYKPPMIGGEVYMHQDNRYWHLEPPRAATLWVALDDAVVESGCVHFIKGSHRLGRVEHRRAVDGRSILLEAVADKADSVPIEVPAGSATLHDCRVLHWSPENSSPRPRRAYTVQYVAEGVTARGEPLLEWRPLVPISRTELASLP